MIKTEKRKNIKKQINKCQWHPSSFIKNKLKKFYEIN